MTLAHHRRNSTGGGHSSASMLAPHRRMTVMKSAVYLGDDLKAAALCCPRLFSAVRSSVYVPGDTCQSVYVNVLFLICCYLFVCLSFANREGLSWTEAPQIFAVAHQVNSSICPSWPIQPLPQHYLPFIFSSSGRAASSAWWPSPRWLRCSE